MKKTCRFDGRHPLLPHSSGADPAVEISTPDMDTSEKMRQFLRLPQTVYTPQFSIKKTVVILNH